MEESGKRFVVVLGDGGWFCVDGVALSEQWDDGRLWMGLNGCVIGSLLEVCWW